MARCTGRGRGTERGPCRRVRRAHISPPTAEERVGRSDGDGPLHSSHPGHESDRPAAPSNESWFGSARRNVLARVVQMSQQNREFLKQATHNAARSAAAGAAMKALQSAKEKAGKASPAARGQQGAPEGSGGEVEGVGEGGGKAGAEDTGGAAGVVVGGPGAEIGGDKGAGEAFASMELSLGNLGSLGNFDDDSLHLSGVLPSLDDEEMRLLQKVLQDPAVPISTPKSIPQTNIFKSPRKTS